MTDELEVLLEEEEELEAELAELLAHRTFYYFKKKEQPADGKEGLSGESIPGPGGEPDRQRVQAEAPAEEPSAIIEKKRQQDLTARKEGAAGLAEENVSGPVTLYRMVRAVAGRALLKRGLSARAGTAVREAAALGTEYRPVQAGMAAEVLQARQAPVGALYVDLSRARQAARYRRPTAGQRISLVKETDGAGPVGWDPAEVDRAFQIDARRYDGGFSWQ